MIIVSVYTHWYELKKKICENELPKEIIIFLEIFVYCYRFCVHPFMQSSH